MALSFFSGKRKGDSTGASPPHKQQPVREPQLAPAQLIKQATEIISTTNCDPALKTVIQLLSACLSELLSNSNRTSSPPVDNESEIVVYKIPEPSSTLQPSAAKNHDLAAFDDLSDSIGFAPCVLSVRRLGARSDRGPRPLLVRLGTPAERRIFLAQARKTPSSKTKGIPVPAMTPDQRRRYQLLQEAKMALRDQLPGICVYNMGLCLKSTTGRPTPVSDDSLDKFKHILAPLLEKFSKNSDA